MARYENWETQNLTYGYYDGEACKIVDLYGDFDSWADQSTVVLQAKDLGCGWVRYWLVSENEDLRMGVNELAAEYARPWWRFW
jgi:hypothetical protein